MATQKSDFPGRYKPKVALLGEILNPNLAFSLRFLLFVTGYHKCFIWKSIRYSCTKMFNALNIIY